MPRLRETPQEKQEKKKMEMEAAAAVKGNAQNINAEPTIEINGAEISAPPPDIGTVDTGIADNK
jgi:hypothetical protein